VEEGVVVATASDGRAALASIRVAWPDVVITDVEMPFMDGCELLARIRGLDRSLPVIVMTGQDSPDDTMCSHAFRVIRKPGTTDTVLAAVREALSHRRQTRVGRLLTRARAAANVVWAYGDGPRRVRLAVMAGVGAAAAAALLIVTIRVSSA
jgi:two-component system, NtrC family, C4-dicarboxylate transport response regulator DctD